jgi:stress-induced morphogen
VINDSASHAGHAGARETTSPSGETHFKVALVSPEFEGLATIKRHRLVYQVRRRLSRRNAGVPHRRLSPAPHRECV